MAYRTGSFTTYSTTSQTTSTASINSPVGVQSGDIVCIFGFAHDNSASYEISSSGFTAGNNSLWSGAGQGPASTMSWIYKVAGASEPGSYTVTVGANFDIRMLICAAWTGRKGTTPVNVNSATAQAGSGTPVTYGLTGGTVSANDDGIWVASAGTGNAVFTPPSGFTTGKSLNDNGTSGMTLYFAYQNAMSAGATGTLTGIETGTGTDINGFFISLATGTLPPNTSPLNVVQFVDSGPNAAATTAAVIFNSTPVVGNAALVSINLKGVSPTVSTVTDNYSNVYVKVTGLGYAGGDAELWWCSYIATSGATFTVTVTPSISSSYIVSLMEVAGLLGIDQTNTATGTAGGSSPISITNGTVNSVATDLVVAVNQFGVGYSTGATNTQTPPGNNGVSGVFSTWSFYDTSVTNAAVFGLSSGYKIVTAIETSSAAWTFSTITSDREQMLLASFQGNPPFTVLLGAICL